MYMLCIIIIIIIIIIIMHYCSCFDSQKYSGNF